MITPEGFDEMTRALMAHDATLTADEAERMAADIGDTPEILDGMIQLERDGALYAVPEAVLFPED